MKRASVLVLDCFRSQPMDDDHAFLDAPIVPLQSA